MQVYIAQRAANPPLVQMLQSHS